MGQDFIGEYNETLFYLYTHIIFLILLILQLMYDFIIFC